MHTLDIKFGCLGLHEVMPQLSFDYHNEHKLTWGIAAARRSPYRFRPSRRPRHNGNPALQFRPAYPQA